MHYHRSAEFQFTSLRQGQYDLGRNDLKVDTAADVFFLVVSRQVFSLLTSALEPGNTPPTDLVKAVM